MRLQGGRRVTLESKAQLNLFPENKPAQFRLRLPEMWSLNETWEVGLFQLLLPHTWCNVLTQQVGLCLHYDQQNRDVRMFLQAGTYVTVQDVVEGLLQVMEANAPKEDDIRGLSVALNGQGFYKWTFPNAEFSVCLPAWLGRVLGYLDFDTWTVPFYFCSDQRHPVVEITQRKIVTVDPPKSRSRAVTPWPNTVAPAYGAPSPSIPFRTCTCTATSASRCTWAHEWPKSS